MSFRGPKALHDRAWLLKLAFVPVGAPSGYVLHVAGIHQTGADASLFENLEQWNPIDSSGFQRYRGYPALLEPIG